LIFGVKDNLELIGLNNLNNSINSIDKYILRIDSIISAKQIVGIDIETNEFIEINSLNIKTKQIVNGLNKNFLIIGVTPNPNIKYQLLSGTIYYRLGASNYFEKNEKIYKQSDFESACKNIQQKAEKYNKTNIELFNNTLKEKNKDIDLLNIKINKIEETNLLFQEYIKNIIEKSNTNNTINTHNKIYGDIENQNYQQTNFQFTYETETETETKSNEIKHTQSKLIYYDYNKLINDILKNFFPCFK
jgi:hypothetical protein